MNVISERIPEQILQTQSYTTSFSVAIQNLPNCAIDEVVELESTGSKKDTVKLLEAHREVFGSNLKLVKCEANRSRNEAESTRAAARDSNEAEMI